MWKPLFSMDADESPDGEPIQCKKSTMRIAEECLRTRWNTDTELINFHAHYACSQKMPEFMHKDHE